MPGKHFNDQIEQSGNAYFSRSTLKVAEPQ